MRRTIVVLLLFITAGFSASLVVSPAQADWRWNIDMPKKVKKGKFDTHCKTPQCHKMAHQKAKRLYWHRFQAKQARKQAEWDKWTAYYIPSCTWYGESGAQYAEYARERYVIMNSEGSGARGKFQFMPGTYASRCRHCDWSALDQERSARLEYWDNGTGPWQACH